MGSQERLECGTYVARDARASCRFIIVVGVAFVFVAFVITFVVGVIVAGTVARFFGIVVFDIGLDACCISSIGRISGSRICAGALYIMLDFARAIVVICIARFIGIVVISTARLFGFAGIIRLISIIIRFAHDRCIVRIIIVIVRFDCSPRIVHAIIDVPLVVIVGVIVVGAFRATLVLNGTTRLIVGRVFRLRILRIR